MTTKTIIKKAIYLNDKLFKEQTEYGNSNLYFTEVSDTLNGCFSSGNVDTSTGEANILNAPGSGIVWEPWELPKLTSATEFGTFSALFDSQNVVDLLDKDPSTAMMPSGGNAQCPILWTLPTNVTLKISSVSISQRWVNGAIGPLQSVFVYDTSSGADVLIGSCGAFPNVDYHTQTINFEERTMTSLKIVVVGYPLGDVLSRITDISFGGVKQVQVSTANTLFFNVGGNYPSLKGKLADGTMFERDSIPSISITDFTDGDYNIFVGMDSQEVLSNSYTISKVEPTTKVAGDVWRNTSISPFIDSKYSDSESWENYDKIYCGSITVASGVITNTIQPIFNENGMNESYLVKTYTNGSSWYRVYPDGWCEQGGTYQGTSGGNDRSYSINLLKNYANSTYNLVGLVTSEGGSGSYINTVKVSAKTESTFDIKASGGETFTWDWVAKGYIE